MSTIAEISSGENTLVSPADCTSMLGLPSAETTLKGHSFMSCWTAASVNLRPIRRLASYTVFVGLSDAWFFAASPIRRSVSEKATYEGVTRLPWSLAMISTLPFL